MVNDKQWFRVQSIGTVRRPGTGETASNEFFDPWQESILEVDERWESGLIGIEEFSHLVVLFYLDRAERRRTPRRRRCTATPTRCSAQRPCTGRTTPVAVTCARPRG